MKIVLLSNYLNHHMLPLCRAFSAQEGVSFWFIATKEITEYRKALGYTSYNRDYEFVLRAYESNEKYSEAKRLCDECDVLIYGNAPWDLIRKRLKTKKLTFRYSERVYKKPCPWYQIPLRAIKYNWMYGRNRNLFLLCASAYTAGDYAKTRTFLNRAFKWGYFPDVKKYDDVSVVIKEKKKRTLLWCGRLIDWKHPEQAIAVAKRLREDGIDCTLNMIGSGPMEQKMRDLVSLEGLEGCVRLLGSMSPDRVRKHMEESEIYLFTSDRQEGWGAVLNESMNSACVVVASHAIGSVPFLINDGENGFVYRDGDEDDFYQKVKALCDSPSERARLGRQAYETIVGEWNAEVAAQRLIALSKRILGGEQPTSIYVNGVCSKAELLKDGWR